MHIIAITGRKNSGKTTLIEEIVKKLSSHIEIAVIKHIHHGGVEFDTEGTDTWRIKHAGTPIVIGITPDSLFLNASTNKQDLELALNIIRVINPETKLILLEGFYTQIKEQRDIQRIIVARNLEEINELISDKNKPLAIFCPNCNSKEINKIPIYNNINDIIIKIEKLIKGEKQ
jgi:molybdopterin-guanine dinucleotide biosynthesis protein B